MFQKTVSIIAISILLILLVIVGIFLSYNKGSGTYPPVIGNCPDYWEEQKKNNKNICVNIKSLGTCGISEEDFNLSHYKGAVGNCNKKKFAEQCDLTWDGITNNNDICNKNM